MSLINEALKKAQKQQSEAAAKEQFGSSVPPPPPPPPPSGQTSRGGTEDDPEPESSPVFTARRQRSDKKIPTTLILVAAIVFVGAGGGLWFMLRDGGSDGAVAMADRPSAPEVAVTKEEPKAAVPAPLVVARTQDDEPVSVPAAAALTETTPIITFDLPTVDAAEGESTEPELVAAPSAKILAAKSPVATTPLPESRSGPMSEQAGQPAFVASPPPLTIDAGPVASPPDVVPDQRPLQRTPTGKVVIAESDVPTARGMPKASAQSTVPNSAVLNYLERTRVTGIRVSNTDPKVLMNDRVYRLNEVVDRDLQLRVIEINPRELRFQDVQGHVYRKTF